MLSARLSFNPSDAKSVQEAGCNRLRLTGVAGTGEAGQCVSLLSDPWIKHLPSLLKAVPMFRGKCNATNERRNHLKETNLYVPVPSPFLYLSVTAAVSIIAVK